VKTFGEGGGERGWRSEVSGCLGGCLAQGRAEGLGEVQEDSPSEEVVVEERGEEHERGGRRELERAPQTAPVSPFCPACTRVGSTVLHCALQSSCKTRLSGFTHEQSPARESRAVVVVVVADRERSPSPPPRSALSLARSSTSLPTSTMAEPLALVPGDSLGPFRLGEPAQSPPPPRTPTERPPADSATAAPLCAQAAPSSMCSTTSAHSGPPTRPSRSRGTSRCVVGSRRPRLDVGVWPARRQRAAPALHRNCPSGS